MQQAPSYAEFVAHAPAFNHETVASGRVHWWHLLFPLPSVMPTLRPRKVKGASSQVESADEAESDPKANLESRLAAASEKPHPFLAAQARATNEQIVESGRPLYAPGSAAHRSYVTHIMATGHFSGGMAHLIVRKDPVWAGTLASIQQRTDTAAQTDVAIDPVPEPAMPASPMPVSPDPERHDDMESPVPRTPHRSPSSMLRRLLGSRETPVLRSRSPQSVRRSRPRRL
jgi:hypothetical protein